MSRKTKVHMRNAESSSDINLSLRDDRRKAYYQDINVEQLTNKLCQGDTWVKPR